jgi:hypothetical protein
MLLAALFALHCIAHQICNNGAFVLAFKDRVERILDVFRDAEIDGRHSESLFVENFNNIVMRNAVSIKFTRLLKAVHTPKRIAAHALFTDSMC